MSDQTFLTPQAIKEASFHVKHALEVLGILQFFGRITGGGNLSGDMSRKVSQGLTTIAQCREDAVPVIRAAQEFLICACANEPLPALATSEREFTAPTWHDLALGLVGEILLHAGGAVLEMWPVLSEKLLRIPKVEIGPFAARLKRESSLAARAMEQAAIQSVPASQGETASIPLKPDDETILLALGKVHPTAMQQCDLESETGISHKTVSKRIEYLKTKGLIDYPFGARSGVIITPLGAKHITKHNPQGTLSTH